MTPEEEKEAELKLKKKRLQLQVQTHMQRIIELDLKADQLDLDRRKIVRELEAQKVHVAKVEAEIADL